MLTLVADVLAYDLVRESCDRVSSIVPEGTLAIAIPSQGGLEQLARSLYLLKEEDPRAICRRCSLALLGGVSLKERS